MVVNNLIAMLVPKNIDLIFFKINYNIKNLYKSIFLIETSPRFASANDLGKANFF